MQVILGEEDQRLSDTSSKIVSILNSSLLLSNVDDDDDTKRRYSLTSFYVEIALRRFYDAFDVVAGFFKTRWPFLHKGFNEKAWKAIKDLCYYTASHH